MKRLLAFAAVVITIAATFTTSVWAAGKVEWTCKTKATTVTCSLDECGVATSEPGKLSLWATGVVNGVKLLHFIQLAEGRIAMQQWTDMEGAGKPVPGNLRVDVFQRDCVGDQQLKELPAEMQEQFMGMYDIPAPVAIPAATPTPEGPTGTPPDQ